MHRLRAEHDLIAIELADLRRVADTLPELPLAARDSLIRVAIELCRRFERHAHNEERDVYPEVARLAGEQLAAVMRYDHRAVEAAAPVLAAIDPLDSPRLQALLYGLHTLISAHIDKEEQIVFPLLDPQSLQHSGKKIAADLPSPWEVRISQLTVPPIGSPR